MATKLTLVGLVVDEENNAEEFWDSLRATYPIIARALESGAGLVVTPNVADAIFALGDGLIELDYREVAAERHQYFGVPE